ncbi:hypothetical protein I3842_07G147000 [Carya illinoinensis]|uniref:Uncharacterized protein n=1 Tax=Carya illinoinensis TaxID=32201 RepID=A0A922ELC5_CARIL|nr:hypothetical protein I3842_07G147000 [Carya illinoinensis]
MYVYNNKTQLKLTILRRVLLPNPLLFPNLLTPSYVSFVYFFLNEACVLYLLQWKSKFNFPHPRAFFPSPRVPSHSLSLSLSSSGPFSPPPTFLLPTSSPSVF